MHIGVKLMSQNVTCFQRSLSKYALRTHTLVSGSAFRGTQIQRERKAGEIDKSEQIKERLV